MVCACEDFQIVSQECALEHVAGAAVKGAAFLEQEGAVDADDFAFGEGLADELEGALIVFGLIESRNEDRAIEHNKIQVTRWERGFFIRKRVGQGDFGDVGHFAVHVNTAELKTVTTQAGVARVLLVVCGGYQNVAASREAGDVVDVAVGVVEGQTIFEPDKFVYS